VVLLCASLGRLEKEQPGKGRNRGIISFSAAEIRASKLAFLSLTRRARFVTLGASMSKWRSRRGIYFVAGGSALVPPAGAAVVAVTAAAVAVLAVASAAAAAGGAGLERQPSRLAVHDVVAVAVEGVVACVLSVEAFVASSAAGSCLAASSFLPDLSSLTVVPSLPFLLGALRRAESPRPVASSAPEEETVMMKFLRLPSVWRMSSTGTRCWFIN
jgi:hypothetical protein